MIETMVELGPYLDAATIDVIANSLAADDPLLRMAALQGLESPPLDVRVQLAFPALSAPVLAVRIEAARLLAALPAGNLPSGQRSQLEKGREEYIQAQLPMAERPEAQVNLGNMYAARGETGPAIDAYRTAIELNSAVAPAYVNHADLLRRQNEEEEVEAVLRRAVAVIPDNGDVYHALGLSLVRQKRTAEAIAKLEQATKLSSDNVRYVYVYAVALNSTGKT